jgi:transcription initiation factor TFIIIB Brf1 subunit/transcription initiation factor TFIIB
MRSLLVKKTAIYTKDEYEALLRPCVYTLWQDKTPLYVGKSTRGIARALSPDHIVRKTLKEAGIIITATQIQWCSTVDEIEELESLLVQRLNPEFNKCHPTTYIERFAKRFGTSAERLREILLEDAKTEKGLEEDAELVAQCLLEEAKKNVST